MSFRLNPVSRLNPPTVSKARDGLVGRCRIGRIGNPVSASLNPGWAFSFKVEEIGFGRSFFRRDFKLLFNILGANGS